MPEECSTANDPLSSFYSTNLSHRICSYDALATRIAYSFGYPQVNVELHQNQVYDAIAQSIELFSKYAGYTEEYLVFRSDLYEPGKGLPIADLFSITPEMYNTYSTTTSDASGNCTTATISGSWDDKIDDYRKVIDVFTFEEGTSTGVNTLFTLEQTLAQQTYFSYAMGQYGFDLVSWQVLKEWLETRRKVLSQDFYYRFNERTQRLFLTPEPAVRSGSTFWGLVGAYVEKPIRELVKERWVFEFARSVLSQQLIQIRGKYSGTPLFGGGSVNYAELQYQAQQEQERLLNQLYEGVNAGQDGMGMPALFVG